MSEEVFLSQSGEYLLIVPRHRPSAYSSCSVSGFILCSHWVHVSNWPVLKLFRNITYLFLDLIVPEISLIRNSHRDSCNFSDTSRPTWLQEPLPCLRQQSLPRTVQRHPTLSSIPSSSSITRLVTPHLMADPDSMDRLSSSSSLLATCIQQHG